MKPIHCLAAGLCLLASGLAFARPPVASASQGGTVDERVAVLERELSITTARLLAAEKGLENARGLLEQVVGYLEAQAQASDAMVATLNESEQLGFAWGENYRSREVLLDGWHQQLATVKQDLPRPANGPAGAKAKVADAPKPPK